MRENKDVTARPDSGHPDDIAREDLVALDQVLDRDAARATVPREGSARQEVA
jgi:hypothetical protein